MPNKAPAGSLESLSLWDTNSPATQKSIVVMHPDGACKGNPGKGGWGVLIEDGDLVTELFGGENPTTNNRMELMAVIKGLGFLEGGRVVHIHTDSQYVQKGMLEWIVGWQRKGWKTANGDPVKNKDLWVELLALAKKHSIEWHWVKGHAGHPKNERADALANKGVLASNQN